MRQACRRNISPGKGEGKLHSCTSGCSWSARSPKAASSQDQAKKRPQPDLSARCGVSQCVPSEVRYDLCMARIWGEGYGRQCQRLAPLCVRELLSQPLLEEAWRRHSVLRFSQGCTPFSCTPFSWVSERGLLARGRTAATWPSGRTSASRLPGSFEYVCMKICA